MRRKGFTLAELAIVLVIVSLLLGGLLMPLSAQYDSRQVSETEKTLSDIRDALLGYAAANGRLPCPASAVSNGIESPPPPSVGSCTNPYDGFVPAATLGIGPTDSSGYVIDAWGNRIHYALASETINGVSNVFSAPSGMKNATLPQIAAYTNSNPLLSVCSAGSAVTGAGTGSATCNSTGKLTDNAVVVIYSLGKNFAQGGNSGDEQHNPNPNAGIGADPAFVSHVPSPASAAGGEFDDIVIWLAPGTLYNRMIAAGQLP